MLKTSKIAYTVLLAIKKLNFNTKLNPIYSKY